MPESGTVQQIPLCFLPCDSKMRKATFDKIACQKNGSVVINGDIEGGHVFCGSEREDHCKNDDPYEGMWVGEYLQATGATVEYLRDDVGEGWSGDMGTGRFAVTHDGSSYGIRITYGTRAD